MVEDYARRIEGVLVRRVYSMRFLRNPRFTVPVVVAPY